MVLRLLATGDDEPSPPDEEAGQALENNEQRQQTFASLYPYRCSHGEQHLALAVHAMR